MEIRHKRVRESTKELYWKILQKVKGLPKEFTKTKWDKLRKLVWDDKGFWDSVIKNKLDLTKMIPFLVKLLGIKEDE